VWLYVPSECLNSAPASAGSASPSGCSTEPEPALWVTLSGKPARRPLSWPAWTRRTWIGRLTGTISRPSTAARGAAEWIASLPGSPASLRVARGNDRARPTSGGSGPTLHGSLARWNRRSSSWRTCQGSLLSTGGPHGERFSGRWPTWGSMRSGPVSVREPAEPRRSVTGCSSWPTAQAFDAHDFLRSPEARTRALMRGGCRNLREAVARWAAPSARDWRDGRASAATHARNARPLNERAIMWNTPCAAPEAPNRNCNQRDKPGSLGEQARLFSPPDPVTPTHGQSSSVPAPNSRRRLNPRFVEWLMGLPIGWTGSGCSETQWCRWLQRMRLQLCSLGLATNSG
jgi:hypothetical protein